MNDKRQKLITKLEALKKYVDNPKIIKSDSLREDLKTQLDSSINHTRFGRYHVTTLGAFSTGKSTLLNAILGANYLPSKKFPTTAITTEIYFDNTTLFFIKFDDIENEKYRIIKKNVERSLKELFSNQEIIFIDKINRDGNSFSGVGGKIKDSNLGKQKKAELLSKVLSELTDQDKRKSIFFSNLKNELNSNPDLTLWVAIDDLPEWLNDIVLTDVPGAGSINSKHEIIINKVIPESQLILYLLCYDKTGTTIDADLCDRISNSYHRKVFYIINKYDTGDINDFDITVEKAKGFIPKCNDENIKPEFYKLSALYYLTSTTLRNKIITKEDVYDNNEINLTKLLRTNEYREVVEKEPEETNLIAKYLNDKSFFANIQERIEKYLREENKTEAIFYQGLSNLTNIHNILVKNCRDNLAVIQSDKKLDELKEKYNSFNEKREESIKDMKTIIDNFKKSLENPNKSYKNLIKDCLDKEINNISSDCKKILENNNNFKEFSKDRDKWLNDFISYGIRNALERTNTEVSNYLEEDFKSLIISLRPILEKLINNSFDNYLQELDLNNKHQVNGEFNQDNLLKHLAIGTTAGGGLGLAVFTIGATTATSTTIIPASGAASWPIIGWILGKLGFGTAAHTVTTSSAPLLFGSLGMGPTIAIAAGGAAAIAGGVWLFNKIKNDKPQVIADGVKKIVSDYFYNGLKNKNSSFPPQYNAYIDSWQEQIDTRLKSIVDQITKWTQQMEEKEKSLISQVSAEKNIKESNINFLNNTLKGLNEIKIDDF